MINTWIHGGMWSIEPFGFYVSWLCFAYLLLLNYTIAIHMIQFSGFVFSFFCDWAYVVEANDSSFRFLWNLYRHDICFGYVMFLAKVILEITRIRMIEWNNKFCGKFVWTTNIKQIFSLNKYYFIDAHQDILWQRVFVCVWQRKASTDAVHLLWDVLNIKTLFPNEPCHVSLFLVD